MAFCLPDSAYNPFDNIYDILGRPSGRSFYTKFDIIVSYKNLMAKVFLQYCSQTSSTTRLDASVLLPLQNRNCV